MKAHIPIDDLLIQKAMAATGATSVEAAVDIALRQLVQGARPKDLMELAGRIEFRADYDHKALRDLKRDAR